MRTRIFAVLAIAILAGGGLAYGTYNFMQNQPVHTVTTPTQPVVVASANLQLGAELKKEDLTVVHSPAERRPRDVLARPSDDHRPRPDRSGRQERADPQRQAGVEGSGFGLPPVIPEGMRAVSVRVNEVIGVAGYVLPGTRVDVVATASPTEARADMTSKVILSNVQVLTAGTRMEQDQEKGKPMQVTVVTLLVNPEQSERLALASTEGKIQLALRNPLDQGAPETPGIKTAGLMGAVRTAPVRQTSGSASRAKRWPGDAVRAAAAALADRGNDPRRQARDRSNQVAS